MAIAGKVAITLATENGGAWSADVTYDRLVAVKHNNNLYISRKTVANVEPPNDEFWFLALEGYSGADVQALIDRLNELSDLIQAIITGTQQVGNAKTLDGHGAEFFVPFEELAFPTNKSAKLLGTITDISELDSYYGKNGYVAVNITGSYAQVLVMTVGATCMQVYMSTYGEDNRIKKIRFRNATATWSDWFEFANYLPLTANTQQIMKVANKYAFQLNNSIADATEVYLAMTGAKTLGFYGFNAENVPVFRDSSGINRAFLHTGNKPTGTYTGNGSSTARQVNVGGIGNMLLINGDGLGSTIVTPFGGFCAPYDGTSVVFIKDVAFQSGVLYMSTDSKYVNTNGKEFRYEVH